MKTLATITKIILVFLFLGQQWLFAQTKEIPITTSSKEALKLFLEARERSENFETAEAALLYDKAIAPITRTSRPCWIQKGKELKRTTE